MTEYEILLASELEPFVDDLGSRKVRMFREEVKRLGTDPFPADTSRSKQSLDVDGKQWFWFRVGRSWYLFYTVDEEAKEVRIVDVQDSDVAYERGLV